MPAGQEQLLGNLGGIILALMTTIPLISLTFFISDPESMALQSIALQTSYLSSVSEPGDEINMTPDTTYNLEKLSTDERQVALETESFTINYPFITPTEKDISSRNGKQTIS